MSVIDTLSKALMEGYATKTIDTQTMFICIGFAAVLSIPIFLIYKLVNRNTFYSKEFNLSLIGLSVITSAIILTIQSNIVVSLGMVGALSIVRFRTAIKNPLDLVFLFWSISVGIICGAGYAMIAIIASVVFIIVIILFVIFPQDKGSKVLVVDCSTRQVEEQIMDVVEYNTRHFRVRARTATRGSLNLAIEIKTNREDTLINNLLKIDGVESASVVEHDGDITA